MHASQPPHLGPIAWPRVGIHPQKASNHIRGSWEALLPPQSKTTLVLCEPRFMLDDYLDFRLYSSPWRPTRLLLPHLDRARHPPSAICQLAAHEFNCCILSPSIHSTHSTQQQARSLACGNTTAYYLETFDPPQNWHIASRSRPVAIIPI
jgi:hypothetical protein